MKKLALYFIAPLTLIISLNGYGQEVDSIIEELSSEQISIAKKIIETNDNSIDLPQEDSSNKEQSLIENCDSISGVGCDNSVEKSSGLINKFGYNFISTSPTSIVATGDLPLPNDYQISLGDVIGVVLSGSKEDMFDMKVQLDGTVFFPGLGSIAVAGESFKDIKIKITNLVENSYIGVSIDLSLKDLSAKKITIVGAVNNPGTYLVNPFTTISNSLAYSGGIQTIGTLRDIKLIRSGGDIYEFDLYDLLIYGDRTSDITIQSGDVIVVGAANKFVNISGMVNRPASYEIMPGESLSDLLKYSLGFLGGANIKKITLDKFDAESSSVIKIVTDDTSYSMENILSVNIFELKTDDVTDIFVSGAVREPGYYKVEDYENLQELIDKLDFIDVYPWLATLEQFDEDNLIESTILFNLNDPDTYRSIKLFPNSRLFFANSKQRSFSVSSKTRTKIADYSLTINHKQGSYKMPVFGRYSLKSFIDLLGLDMTEVDQEAVYISPLDNIVIKDDYRNMQFNAKKYNTVSFRSPINELIRVNISGAIDYPGIYTLQPDSTLQDLYEMIGDFKPEAFLDGVIFTRKSIRERQIESLQRSKDALNKSILVSQQKGENIGDASLLKALSESIEPANLGRIAGDFSPDSISSISTILLDGDSVIIPRNPNAINVLGEVLNPIAFQYSPKLTVSSAVAQAGGFQEYADKRKVYVIKANGMIEKAGRNIFVKNVKLEPGDSIVVPRKIITNSPGIDLLLPITQILSDLAFSAAALESLSSSK